LQLYAAYQDAKEASLKAAQAAPSEALR
jgi:hypothetical protein